MKCGTFCRAHLREIQTRLLLSHVFSLSLLNLNSSLRSSSGVVKVYAAQEHFLFV